MACSQCLENGEKGGDRRMYNSHGINTPPFPECIGLLSKPRRQGRMVGKCKKYIMTAVLTTESTFLGVY